MRVEAGQQRSVEVRSTLWQNAAALCIFALLEAISLPGLLSILFPNWLYNQSIHNASGLENAFVFAGLLVIGFLAFYIWWATLKYLLFADETGIMQTNGFCTVRLCWEEISSYKWQVRRGTSDRYLELVLRDQSGKITFRPLAPALISDKSIMLARTEFWKFVAEKIDDTSRKC